MNFGRLRSRVLLMKRNGTVLNSMNEEVPAYEMYHPGLNSLSVYEENDNQGVAQFVTTQGNSGDVSIYYYWADVRPTTGREYEEAQKIRAETTYNVHMRYVPGITHDMFIVFNNKNLKIESVLDIEERHKELTIVCSEVQR